MGNHHHHHLGVKTDKPILVTGGTGYIAAHIIELLLNEGLTVRTTVRSLQNSDKIEFLNKMKHHERLMLVEADLCNKDSWDNAVSGCEYVIHVASPVPAYIPKDENEVIGPAVEGAKNVLSASIKNNVKRFIFTSSGVTMYFGNQDKPNNEGMWADPSKCSAYGKSKVLAEQAIWELYKGQNLQSPHTEVVSLLPCLVLGPGLTKHGNPSEVLIAEIMKGGYPGIPEPDILYSVVDVRDVALAHCLALFKPNLDGQRVALSAESVPLSQIFQWLHEAYPQCPIRMQKVSKQEIQASNNPIAQRGLQLMGKKVGVQNAKSIELLGIKYTSPKDSVLDMAKQLKKFHIVN